MPRLPRSLFLLAALALALPTTASAQLIISEYIEGSGFNKAIEIYNTTAGPVNLGDYMLRLYSNGAAAPTASVALFGPLASGAVYVVANPTAAAGILGVANLTSGTVINYNGDDAFELYHIPSATSVDVIGQIGVDPGVEWVGGGVSTLNRTLRRKVSVCSGDANGGDVFDPSLQWNGFAIDVIDGLGTHDAQCHVVPTRSSTWGRVKAFYH